MLSPKSNTWWLSQLKQKFSVYKKSMVKRITTYRPLKTIQETKGYSSKEKCSDFIFLYYFKIKMKATELLLIGMESYFSQEMHLR